MLLLAFIAITTLAANGARQLRYGAVAFLGVALTAIGISAQAASGAQLAIAGCAAAVSAGILYVAARDNSYGEEPGWRLWAATIVAAAATPAAFASFRTAAGDSPQLPLLGSDDAGVTAQVAAFWLLSSGIAILLTARSAVRMSLGALLMVTAVQLLARLAGGTQLALTLIFASVQIVVALVGAFLIVNERAVHES